MATLFNTKISATYQGLFKTIDNAVLSASLRELTDGAGNQSGLFLNTAGDFKVTSVLEWGSLKDTGTGVTITQFVTAANGIENFNNDTTLPTSAAVKLYVDTKFSQTDTLTEVLGFGNTTSGKDIAVSAGDDITFTDSSKILMGAGSDLQIFHDGNDSFIKDVGQGQLKIAGSQILLYNAALTGFLARYVDGGGSELYFNTVKRFETTNTGAEVNGNLVVTGTITGAGGSFLPLAGGTMTGNTIHNDNVKSIYGTASDGLEIFHNGSNSFISDTGTGSLFISGANNIYLQNGSNETFLDATTNSNVRLFFDNSVKLSTTNTGISVTGALSTTTNVSVGANATFVDNGKALFGDSNDLEIFHNSSTSQNVIQSNLSRQLALQQDNIFIANQAASKIMLTAVADGAVSLYYDNTKRIETVTDGGKVTGNLEVTGTITGAGGSFLPLIGGTMTGNTIHNDNVKSIYGTASDGLEIFHNGNDSIISDTGTGDLKVLSSLFRVQSNGGESMITAFANGAVFLYDNNSQKFRTTSTGISVTGNGIFSANLSIPDSAYLYAGTGLDLSLTHNGTDSFIGNATGQLNIDQAAVTQSIVVKVSNANALDTTALTINREGDLITGKDVTIAGDLTVNGTTTTVNSQTLSVVDPLISLATANTANSLDIGFYGKYNDGTARYLGLFNDASDSNKFKLFRGTTVEPTTTVNVSGAGYVAADLVVAGLEIGSGSSSGNFTFGTGNELRFGSSNEFGLFFSSGTSNIRINSGNLAIRADDLRLTYQDSSKFYFKGIADGAVELFHNNIKKFETTSTGVTVTGAALLSSGEYLSWGTAGSAAIEGSTVSNKLRFYTSSTLALTLDASQNATFAGEVTLSAETQYLNFKKASTSDILSTIVSETDAGTGGKLRFLTKRNGDTQLNALTLDDNQNATFAGNILMGNTVTNPASGFSDQTGIGLKNSTTVPEIQVSSDSTAMQLGRTSTGGEGQILVLRKAGNVVHNFDTNNVSIGTNATFAGNVVLTGAGDKVLDIYRDGGSGHSIRLHSEGVSWINNNNNFGIGTTAPGEKLEVNSGNVKIEAGATSSVRGLIIAHTGQTGNQTLLVQNSSGTPIGHLYTTERALRIEAGANGGTGTGETLDFWVNGSERMMIDTTGNVGIGTTSPIEKLQVEGKVYVQGNGQAWNETTPGLIRGSVHFDPGTNVADTGNALTFGASDSPGAPNEGSNAQAGIYTRSDGAYGSKMYFATSDSYAVGSKTRMMIDFNGNVGVGTTTPVSKLHVASTGAPDIRVQDLDGTNQYGDRGHNAGNTTYVSRNNTSFGSHIFYGANGSATTERMRINAAGDVLFGTTAAPNGTSVYGSGFINDTNDANVLKLASSASGAKTLIQFLNPNGSVGSILTNGSATAYNTSSDYRLKEDLQDFEGLNMVSKIPVYDFKWKVDESRSYGVMAHELQEVLPQAVVGEKDAEEYQAVDYSKIVPVLVKAIQELEAKIKVLEQK